ncbi:MAG TPA: hypothetical protein VD816_13555, partial [Ohtaekwangia sp.]|nr:hypothetical protein [Ohtaekwangia sp.]
SPAYTVLWASGSVWLESLTAGTRYARALRIGLCFLIIFVLIALMPLAVPLLPVEKFIPYSRALGFEPSSNEGKEVSALPQFYADMFGWKEKAASVAAVYNALPEADREKCAIFGNNYGRCGAIDYYGKAYGLPKAIGNHNNYWVWGPRHYTGEVVIIMGGSYEDHVESFETVELAAVSGCDYCMPYEDDMKIFLCRGLKARLSDVWSTEKHYD